MRYAKLTIKGLSGLLCSSAGAMDDTHPLYAERRELAKTSDGKRTPEQTGRLRFLDAFLSMWRTPDDLYPTFPANGIRRVLEDAAKKTRDGGTVREGLLVHSAVFDWDRSLGETCEALANNLEARLTIPVNQSNRRVLRTRALFRDWSITACIEYDPQIITEARIRRFAEIGGARLGIGDWRPQKSGGIYGRYTVEDITETDAAFERPVNE